MNKVIKAIKFILGIISVYAVSTLIFVIIGINNISDYNDLLLITVLVFSVIQYIYLGIRYAAEVDIPRSKFYFYIPTALVSGLVGFIVCWLSGFFALYLERFIILMFKPSPKNQIDTFMLLGLWLFTMITGFVIYECLCACRRCWVEKQKNKDNQNDR